MQGAAVAGAQMQGADLRGVALLGAFLPGVQMQGANVANAYLQGAVLTGAQMQGVNLRSTKLQAADLRYVQLQSADVARANLQGVDLRRAAFYQTTVSAETNLGLADVRGVLWQPMERLTRPGALPDDPSKFELDGLLMVDDVEDPRWQRLDRARLTIDERAYDEALVPFLADLARSDPHVARGLASRFGKVERGRPARLARGLLDRAGSALPEDVRERLSEIASQPVAKE
jgi:hypothetical protein